MVSRLFEMAFRPSRSNHYVTSLDIAKLLPLLDMIIDIVVICTSRL